MGPQQSEDYQQKTMPEMPPLLPHRRTSLFKKALLVIVGLVLLTGAVILVVSLVRKPTKTTPTKTTTSQQSAPANSVTKITGATVHYDSTNFSLGFDYPKDWTVNDTDGARLSVTSPILEITNSSSNTIQARIVFAIQHQQSNIPLLAANKAVAVIRSQKISYTSPTQNQRAQTYVTFVNYTGGSQGIDALYITGDNGYQAVQSVPMSDIAHDDPLVTISFLACADSTCPATSTPANISVSSWQDTALSKPLLDLLKSLAIE